MKLEKLLKSGFFKVSLLEMKDYLGWDRAKRYFARIYNFCNGSYLCMYKKIGEFRQYIRSLEKLRITPKSEIVERFFNNEKRKNLNLDKEGVEDWYYYAVLILGDEFIRNNLLDDIISGNVKGNLEIEKIVVEAKGYVFKVFDNVIDVLRTFQEIYSCFSPMGEYGSSALYFALVSKNYTQVGIFRNGELVGRFGIAFNGNRFLITSKVYGAHKDLSKYFAGKMKRMGFKEVSRVKLRIGDTDYFKFKEWNIKDDNIEWMITI